MSKRSIASYFIPTSGSSKLRSRKFPRLRNLLQARTSLTHSRYQAFQESLNSLRERERIKMRKAKMKLSRSISMGVMTSKCSTIIRFWIVRSLRSCSYFWGKNCHSIELSTKSIEMAWRPLLGHQDCMLINFFSWCVYGHYTVLRSSPVAVTAGLFLGDTYM